MAWGILNHPAQLTNITTQQHFSAAPSLAESGIALCQIQVVYPGGAVDGLRVEFRRTLDATSEVWDTDPFTVYTMAVAETAKTFVVRDCYKFRVSVSRDGSTDTITSADLYYRTGVI
jgi:hypothetical protein